MPAWIKKEEIRTPRELVRELNSTLNQLEGKQLEKIVIVSGSEVRGVLISADEYERLAEGA